MNISHNKSLFLLFYLIGSLAIMVPILFIGALATVLLPKTAFKSLEDINYMNEALEEDENEEEKAEKLKDSEEEMAKKIEAY